MTQIYSWEDSFDRETADKSGNFCLYRNYCIKHNNEEFNYEFLLIPGTLNWNPLLYLTTPVAKGITVYYCNSLFFEKSLFQHLSDDTSFSTHYIYENYFDKLFNVFLNKFNSRPTPVSKDEVECIFLPQHLKDETISLLESEKYYTECINENDRILKAKIREYVTGYFGWLKAKIDKTLVIKSNSALPERETNQNSQTSVPFYSNIIENKQTNDDSQDIPLVEELSKILFPLYHEDINKRIIEFGFKSFLTSLFLSHIEPAIHKKPTTKKEYYIIQNQSFFYKILSEVLIKYLINPNRIKKDISEGIKGVSEKTVGNNLPTWKHIKISH